MGYNMHSLVLFSPAQAAAAVITSLLVGWSFVLALWPQARMAVRMTLFVALPLLFCSLGFGLYSLYVDAADKADQESKVSYIKGRIDEASAQLVSLEQHVRLVNADVNRSELSILSLQNYTGLENEVINYRLNQYFTILDDIKKGGQRVAKALADKTDADNMNAIMARNAIEDNTWELSTHNNAHPTNGAYSYSYPNWGTGFHYGVPIGSHLYYGIQ